MHFILFHFISFYSDAANKEVKGSKCDAVILRTRHSEPSANDNLNSQLPIMLPRNGSGKTKDPSLLVKRQIVEKASWSEFSMPNNLRQTFLTPR